MPTPYDLSGLIAWTKREEWRGVLAEVIERHCAMACAGAEIEPEEIEDVLGDEVGPVLWGAAFEDLLATDLPDGRNLADDYLRRRAWKESATTRDYITGLRRSAISLYEVSGIVPGESMLLRDLVRGGDPVRVFEKRGSEGLRPWDRVATRVIPLRGGAVISGTLMHFEQDAAGALLASLHKIQKGAPREVASALKEFGIEPDPEVLSGLLSADEVLARAAFMFTNLWLSAALEAEEGSELPELLNSDGDPFEITTLHFPLRPGVTAQKVRAALSALPALRPASPSFWNWLAEPRAKPKTVPHTTRGLSLTTSMDDGMTVLGTLELKGRRLTLEVNSAPRAERGRAMLEPVLAGLVGPALTERTDLEEALAVKRPPPEPTGLTPEEEREVIQEAMHQHYTRVLDEPLPALGGKSPRAASRTRTGRQKVVGWLKMLENSSARHDPGSPMAGYDFGWIWGELGIEDLRR